MAISEVANAPWSRKHDLPGTPLIAQAPRTVYPTKLEELIALCANRKPHERLHAAGSHWALSPAALSDHTFIETHDPNDVFQATQFFPAMDKTLFDVVPGCLHADTVARLAQQTPLPYDAAIVSEDEGTYYIHIETGKRVYQLYCELDFGHDRNKQSLAWLINERFGNPSYFGPWAFRTLGGAGGQTVYGALTTGTHGGDHKAPPIADSVVAMHLVADGGKHYWIEPSRVDGLPTLTNEDLLQNVYGAAAYGGRSNFKVVRDDALFNAVLMAAGRFGVVYSIVLRAVRQYTLHEERRLSDWQTVSGLIANPANSLFDQKFLQIAVNVVPYANGSMNQCAVSKRWNAALAAVPATGEPFGRAERRGDLVPNSDPPAFTHGGNQSVYRPNPANPNQTLPPSFLARACSNADFMDGVVESVCEEIQTFLNDNAVPIGGALAAVTVIGGAAALAVLAVALAAILLLLLALLALLKASRNKRLAEVLNDLQNTLLNQPTPELRAAGVVAWQAIGYKLFESEQGTLDYEAISYAVMDGHDYLDKSCNVNVDSLEVFFSATDPQLVAYIDALLTFERNQEFQGRSMVGYISLRFTGASRALLAPEQFTRTCVIEIAALLDAGGSKPLIDHAVALALDPNFRGILHWGQRNDSLMQHTEQRFGDAPGQPFGPLAVWRQELAAITDHGRLDGFSSQFTRRTGLEVVAPHIDSLSTSTPQPRLHQLLQLHWDCAANPPGTRVALAIVTPGGQRSVRSSLGLAGHLSLPATQRGLFRFTLTATRQLNGRSRRTSRSLALVVV